MNRRHFLTLVSLALASQPLSACGAGANRDRSAQIALLEDAIPDQLIRTFRRRLSDGVQLRLTAASQFADLYDLLLNSQAAIEPGAEPDQAEQSETRQFWQFWRRSTPTSADLISLSDNWLSAAIQQDLIQPLALAELHAWSTLDSRWQALVTRTTAGAPSDGLPSTDAKLWGAPYRWGYLMLTYRDRPLRQLGGAPTDWDALWRPELQNQIALPDNPHLVLAIVLRKLGLSANLVDLTPHLADLEAALTQLNQQVKFYSSTHHLQALVTEGVSLAAGWSTDILPLLRRYRNLRAVSPASGTLLSADVWVKPKIAELASEVAQPQDLKAPLADWLSFFWEPQVATQLTVTNPGASPLYSHLENPQLPEPLKTVSNLLPTAETYDQSEFLNPLSPATQAQALALWSKVSPAAPDR